MVSGGLVAVLGLSSAGCFDTIAANGTVDIMARAAPALERQADPGIAESALPYSLVQMEGLLTVVPNNRHLRLQAIRAYGSFAFGFLDDRREQAEADDDEVRMDHYNARATAAYLRAKELGLQQMNIDEPGDGGATAAYHQGIDAWNRYVQRFDDADAVPLLFWTGYAWGNYIGLHRDDVTAIADLPFAVALFERALALDPTYMHGAPHAAMGSVYASRPAALGGDPVRARAEFEAAIALTHRHYLQYLVIEAHTYAVMVQDRALYHRLLQEVVDAGDVDPDQRLANQLAKRRAQRYLAQENALFGDANSTGPDAPAGGDSAVAAPAATPPAAAEGH